MDRKDTNSVPAIVQETIDRVVKKMRYRKKARADVRAELQAHFEDALADCRTPEKQQERAEELIGDFGDAQVLGTLIRRAKKRCRPVWIKAMIHTSQVASLCLLYGLLCVSQLYIGSPTISVDTFAKINETAKQGHGDALNALPGIQSAVGLLPPTPQGLWEYPHYADMNDTQRSAMDTYLAENQAALEAFQAAVAKPYYWRHCDPVPIMLGDTGAGLIAGNHTVKTIELPHSLADQVMSGLPGYRLLAQVLRFRVERAVVRGDADKALADAVAIQRFGSLLIGPGLLTEQLVGMGLTAMGRGTVMYVVNAMDPNALLLARTHAALEGLFDWDRPWIEYSIEEAMVEDLIQHGFTDDGQGNGRPLASSVLLVAGSPSEWWKKLVLFDYPDRKQVTEDIEQFFHAVDQAQAAMPWIRRDQDRVPSHTQAVTLYTAMTKPALERVGEQEWRCRIACQSMMTVLAIKHYQAVHGVLPESLQDVVTDGLMKTLPRDFYSDGPLTYRRKSDTEFVLYSWGEDLKDDGGRPSTNAKGVAKLFYPEGDWVFWPIPR